MASWFVVMNKFVLVVRNQHKTRSHFFCQQNPFTSRTLSLAPVLCGFRPNVALASESHSRTQDSSISINWRPARPFNMLTSTSSRGFRATSRIPVAASARSSQRRPCTGRIRRERAKERARISPSEASAVSAPQPMPDAVDASDAGLPSTSARPETKSHHEGAKMIQLAG